MMKKTQLTSSDNNDAVFLEQITPYMFRFIHKDVTCLCPVDKWFAFIENVEKNLSIVNPIQWSHINHEECSIVVAEAYIDKKNREDKEIKFNCQVQPLSVNVSLGLLIQHFLQSPKKL